MFAMVAFIATLIHIFATGYMAEETQQTVEDHQVHGEDGHYRRRGRYNRFFMFFSLFCFSMLNLVMADNFFQVFISLGACRRLFVLADRLLLRAAHAHRTRQTRRLSPTASATPASSSA